jgi:DNA topoisomerase-2
MSSKKQINSKSKNELTVEEKYKSMTDHEHILKLPDTYIGGIEEDNIKMWVFDEETKHMVFKLIKYIPGLFKIFDEILVNARDQTVRDPTCNEIRVMIDKENGISIWNNGDDGIPVVIHKEEGCYVTEMIFGKIRTSANYEIKGKTVGGRNGLGAKCISPDTPIPLWNGQIKKANELTVDDKLIGDDGTIRNIKKIINGNGQMYEIEQTKGETYKVNDRHILTLHMPSHKIIFWNVVKNGWSTIWWDNNKKCIGQKTIRIPRESVRCPKCDTELINNLKIHYKVKHPKLEIPADLPNSIITTDPDSEKAKKIRIKLEEFCRTIPDLCEFDMNIQDYMKLSNTTKRYLAGIRSDCIQWEKKEVLLDPYVLGLWLGDGESRGYGYSCYGEKDPEIINYLIEWGKNNNAKINKAKQPYTYYIASSIGKGYTSPIASKLRHYNLIHNKHIPIDYIVNDRDTRLKVLAGLIDTDGHVANSGTRIQITQGLDHKKLIEDIVLLSRSLGFYTCLTIRNNSWKYKGVLKRGKAYVVNISGNIEDIPTKLPRKKCTNIRVHSNKSTGKIRIKDIGNGDYVGIEVDSNQRFVINDFTVTHNCTNIYSEEFIVDVVDAKRLLKFTQIFKDNMYTRGEPVIEKLKGKQKSYTKISFKPDYKRFGIEELSDDMMSLFKKRVYDIAAVTNIKVFLNDEQIKIKDFEDYIAMFYTDGEIPNPPIYEVPNDRWKIGVVYDPNSGYKQISYVNGICTYQGGSHVTYIVDQIVDTIYDQICNKNKNLKIKKASIRDNLTFFINAVIEDPGFSSQTKEFLTTKSANFGSTCVLSEKFIKEVSKTGIVDEVVNFAKFRAMEELKKFDGKKKENIKGLVKLVDAHWAGTRKAHLCTLILTEGDSAKNYAIAGTEIVGKDTFGVFPLRGKLLNVREASAKQLVENEEIKNIMKIMGLKHGKKYIDVKQLRYGRIAVLADRDYDGSHIKGLIMNFVHFFWPSLLINIKGFLIDPPSYIVKIWKTSDTKKQNAISFTTLTEYEDWKKKIGVELKNYKYKYYKGLGTSTYEEAKEAFLDFENKIVQYIWNLDKEAKEIGNQLIEEEDEDQEEEEEEIEEDNKSTVSSNDEEDDLDKTSESYKAIVLAFAKNQAGQRKIWLSKYDKNIILGTNKLVTYDEFIHKDLIHFSNYDNIRSIASLIDGLKPSLRKILYGCLLKKLFKDEIKVSQLAGFISENTGYHHGEASLQGAIVGMAQNFVGANNINLLLPNGDFGNRSMGGKNAASARYIYTLLNELIPRMFRKEDECIYKYNDDDGTLVEPETYAPITCEVLINGTSGIGTGFSSDVPCFNPGDINKNLRLLIAGKEPVEMIPWYRGFRGKVVVVDDYSFETWGLYDIQDENTIIIDELPVETWTENYKAYLDNLCADDPKNPQKGQILRKYIDDCSNNTVKFTIVFLDNVLQELIKKNEIEKRLKLINKHSMANMHLYNTHGVIKKYGNALDILREYYEYRLEMYNKRKEYYLKVLENQLNIVGWKIKYLDFVINGKIIVFEDKKARSKDNVIQQLIELKFPKLASDIDASEDNKTYNYLTNLKIFDLTDEERKDLKEEYMKKLDEFNIYKNTSVQEIWLKELDEFEEGYKKWLLEQNSDDKDKKPKKNTKKKPIKVKTV